MTEPEKAPATTVTVESKTMPILTFLHIIYITYAIGIVFGIIPFVGLVVSFVPIVGVVLAYIKKPEAKEFWMISHFDWQIRTFWIAFIVTIIGYLTIPLFGLGIIFLLIKSIWGIYRIVKGWLSLYEGKAIVPINWAL